MNKSGRGLRWQSCSCSRHYKNNPPTPAGDGDMSCKCCESHPDTWMKVGVDWIFDSQWDESDRYGRITILARNRDLYRPELTLLRHHSHLSHSPRKPGEPQTRKWPPQPWPSPPLPFVRQQGGQALPICAPGPRKWQRQHEENRW